MLASALLASGSAHSIAGADGFPLPQPPAEALVKPVEPVEPIEPVRPEALPLLALAAVELSPAPPVVPPQPAPKAPAAAVKLPPAAPRPLAAPRRDLAGFLAEQGHVLAPLGEGGDRVAEPLEDTPVPPDPPAAAPAVPLADPALATAVVDDPGPDAAASQTFPILSVDGAALGAVTMRGDTVHLAALLGLLQLRMPAEEFARLKAAPAADSFVSLAMLREAGLAVTVDAAGERLTLAAL